MQNVPGLQFRGSVLQVRVRLSVDVAFSYSTNRSVLVSFSGRFTFPHSPLSFPAHPAILLTALPVLYSSLAISFQRTTNYSVGSS